MFDYRRDPEGICCHPMRFVMFDEVNRFGVLITIIHHPFYILYDNI